MSDLNRTVITVDGLAGTGKTTLSLELARKLGFIHFSTGMLYRAVGYLALSHGISPEDEAQVSELVGKHDISVVAGDDSSAIVLVDGRNVVDQLYVPEVSEATSMTAQLKSVREGLVETQQNAFAGHPIVAEGRDMGSVIFPAAEVKFFVHTEEDVKVERRLKQLIEAGHGDPSKNYKFLKEKMKIEIHERDRRDVERALAPTHQTDDMIVVDNSSDPLEKVVENMYNSVTARGIAPRSNEKT